MKRILVTGAGGAAATNFVRSLRLVKDEKFYLIGLDADKFYLQRSETDEKHLAPCADDADYLSILNDIIKGTGAELIFAQPDVEICAISQFREKLACRTFLPKNETVRICQNKFLSFEHWKRAGLTVPSTIKINCEDDLKYAINTLGPKIWVRADQGAFGKGSMPTEEYAQAKAWIDFQKGWGSFVAAECLESQSVTWQSIWKDGELIVAQGRKRLYWEFGNRAPSGVTGLTGTGVTISDPELDELAQKAIKAIDKKPHGIFSVDMTYDKRHIPNPTEINIGRFFTTHFFFSKAGLNMPYIYVKLAFDEPIEPLPKKINPLPEGLVWIRGIDIEPILTDVKMVEQEVEKLEQRRAHVVVHT